MNRDYYFKYIEGRLCWLAMRTEVRGRLNLLDLNLHSENFYRDLLNTLFGWKLINLNTIEQNVKAIDLICNENKFIVQVSATCTKGKIDSALEKDIIKKNRDCRFKFISLFKDANTLKARTDYSNPHNIQFKPADDIYDISSILGCINDLKITPLKKVFNFIKNELGEEADDTKLDSNLAAVINILSEEDLSQDDQTITIDEFQIQRKITFNDLDAVQSIIDDYKIHHNQLDKIYSEFDASGQNKSLSVLSAVRGGYTKNLESFRNDKLFLVIIENIKERIIESPNFNQMPIEELELCVNILVVDTFIRCKIFKNPKDYTHVIA